MRSVRRFLAAFTLVALVAAPAAAVTESNVDHAGSSHAPAMMDVLVLRPVGLVGLGLSAVLWVPAQLMTLAINPSEWKMPVDHLLAKPARYVFVDPIGTH
jgi:hypothetical protein